MNKIPLKKRRLQPEIKDYYHKLDSDG